MNKHVVEMKINGSLSEYGLKLSLFDYSEFYNGQNI
jgi:hypothetical protein